MTGFCIKCNTELKWVHLLRYSLQSFGTYSLLALINYWHSLLALSHYPSLTLINLLFLHEMQHWTEMVKPTEVLSPKFWHLYIIGTNTFDFRKT